MMCAICISMFQNLSITTEGTHHASFSDLTKAAQSGCGICKSIMFYREEHYGTDDHVDKTARPFTKYRFFDHRYLDHVPNNEQHLTSVRLQLGPPSPGEHSWLSFYDESCPLWLHVSSAIPTPAWWAAISKELSDDLEHRPWHVNKHWPSRRPIPASTGDIAVSQLAVGWLADCRKSHGTCDTHNSSRDSKMFPPRVIFIGEQTCRLIVTDEEDCTKADGYVALSHCWGSNPSIMTLTADNLSSLRDNIPTDRLPKSFLEAIETCRRLGFQYLWIDSLCIMQSGTNSKDDWELHALFMGNIYANCTLNIAIAHASDSTMGCFVDRDSDQLQAPYTYVPDMISPRDSGHMSDSLTRSSSSTSRLITVLPQVFNTERELFDGTHALNTRAWVLQERLMSPRTLHFGAERIYWECNERTLDEYQAWNVSSREQLFRRSMIIPFSLPAQVVNSSYSLGTSKEIIDRLFENYYKIVEFYSETDLTFPAKDKFVALAAIARRFRSAIESPYLAGLFLSGLPLGLLWSVEEELYFGSHETIKLDTERSRKYRAPSW